MYRYACAAPRASYVARRAGSDSVSNASWIRANAAAAPPLSGWWTRAFARYAARISPGVASRPTASAS